ncbi:MAG TPA: radical SAM protein [Solirubrobacterales bacterium]|nr:radical SAM protein [Solirubrobacterales bacterium]
MPGNVRDGAVERIDRVEYGRFRNVYLYITEACQLRCGHCYMGDRLDHGTRMEYEEVCDTLAFWRKMGGSKLTILGGEPTIHPQYCEIIRFANEIGYEHVITTTNGLKPAARKFRALEPDDFAYVQISLDGGSADSHDQIRGRGTFDIALETATYAAARGFDTRFICTVNALNMGDCLALLDIADELGVSLVKYHVFSTIGQGNENTGWAIDPHTWIEFYEQLDAAAEGHKTRVWYQPTYARRSEVGKYADEGYRGCIGRTLDRISVFPDGRCYVCSYLFDTDFNFANMRDGVLEVNRGRNELELFAGVLGSSSCGSCKVPGVCMGGCPAEELVMGDSSCGSHADIVPVCRLWKSTVGASS